MTSSNDRRIDTLSFLIVEDNAFASLVVTKTLTSLGARNIQTAQTGREGLDLIAATQPPPDVLLIDLRMPEMGGMEMIERLADRGYPGHVIVTSGVDDETLASARQIAEKTTVDVLGCLSKPVESAQLLELLDRLPEN